jgi:hypothetical protein
MEQEEAQADGLNLVPILLCVNEAVQAPAERVSPERSEGQREGRSPATAC